MQEGVLVDDGPTLEEIKAEEKAAKASSEKEMDGRPEDLESYDNEEPDTEYDDTDSPLTPVEEASPEAVVASSEESDDYESMTVVQLKELLKAAGKPVSGKKADLIVRLLDNSESSSLYSSIDSCTSALTNSTSKILLMGDQTLFSAENRSCLPSVLKAF